MRLLLALTALLLLPLCACSRTVSVGQIPPPQANLSQPCPPLPLPPIPLVDPPRSQWEADLIAAYADCAARQRAMARSWPASTD